MHGIWKPEILTHRLEIIFMKQQQNRTFPILYSHIQRLLENMLRADSTGAWGSITELILLFVYI